MFFLDGPQRFSLAKDTQAVGREPSCDVFIDDVSISRNHATLWRKDGVWSVVDNKSRNGTFIGDVRLKPNEPMPLRLGGRVRFGNVELVLRQEGAKEPTSGTREFSVAELLPSHTQADRPGLDRLLGEVLFKAQRSLFPAQPVETLLEALLHVLVTYVPADMAAVQLVEQGTGSLRTAAALDRAHQRSNGQIQLSTSVAQKVMQTRTAVLIRDLAQDAEFGGRQSLVEGNVTSLVAAPIFDGEEMYGLLYAQVVKGAQALGEADVAVITLLAALAGTSLVAAQMVADMMKAQHELQRENDALKSELEALKP